MAKARSVAAKRREKRGRPAKGEALRTPSGQISRSKEARSVMSASEQRLALEVATWKRRQNNPTLTVVEASRQEHGSVISRWLLAYQRAVKRDPAGCHENEFNQAHYDAAERFHRLHSAYHATIGSERMKSSSDLNRARGYDGRDPFGQQASEDKAAETAYRAARRAVLESCPLGMMAIETIVLENTDALSLLPDLRCALNRLALLWKWMEAA